MKYDTSKSYEVLEKDVVYRSSDGVEQKARIYSPQGKPDDVFPLLIDLHGGGWRAQFDRTRNRAIDVELASHGIVIASIDFRLNGEAPHPVAMQDINFAIRWFKEHASEFNATAEGIGGLGVSSGGQHLLSAVMRQQSPQYHFDDAPEKYDASLTYAICAGCAYDLVETVTSITHLAKSEYDIWGLYEYLGGIAGVVAESPLHIITSDEPIDLPPLLLLQAGADVLPGLTPDKAVKFAGLYGAKGGNVELAIFPNAPHIFLNSDLAGESEAMFRGMSVMKAYISRQVEHQYNQTTD
jgi:acetyl esterase/lipase